jgi:hypothetical protein
LADSRRASKLRSLRLEAAMKALLEVSLHSASGRRAEQALPFLVFLSRTRDGRDIQIEIWRRHCEGDLWVVKSKE